MVEGLGKSAKKH